MPSPIPTFEKTLAVVLAHSLYSDEDLVQKIQTEAAVLKQEIVATEKKVGGWFQSSKTKETIRQDLREKQSQLDLREKSLAALRQKDYQNHNLSHYASKFLGPGYEQVRHDGMDVLPTPAWRIQELTERTARHPQLTAVWTTWLESNKPMRRVNLTLLDRVAWECRQVQDLETNQANEQALREEAVRSIRRPKP